MFGRITVSALVAIALTIPVTVAASQKFAGRWKRTTFRVKVTIQSWGENCGSEPKGYGSNKIVEVDVISQGPHLVFSRGGMRTDRCMSPNPRLNTVSQSNASGNWSRVCQTPKNDPKFERLESSLKAQGANKLVYTGRTKFDWSLKGDHCIAMFHEKRVYIREGAEEEEPDKPGKKQPPETKKPEPEPVVKPGCEEHGPIKRLILHPKKAQIGPGERVCFKAEGIDANGCRFPVSASWTATQDEQEVGGLLSRGGCFSAGATAAEAEGIYEISARVEGKTAEATVTVSFPDLGDLLAARLKPTDALEEDETKDAGPAQQAPASDPAAAPPAGDMAPQPPIADGGNNTTLLIIVIAAGMVVAIGLLVLALMLRRRPRRPMDLEEEDDWLDQPASPPPRRAEVRSPIPSSPPAAPLKPTRDLREPVSKRSETVICPECSRSFPEGARFCPHDGQSLIPPPVGSGFYPRPGSDAGMICPKCHRGYDVGARFCPHDSEKLMPYKEWRELKRSKRT